VLLWEGAIVLLGVETLFAEGAMMFLARCDIWSKIMDGICRTEDKMPSMGVTDKFRNTTVNKRLLQATATDDMTCVSGYILNLQREILINE
jgi:hypothetical protein